MKKLTTAMILALAASAYAADMTTWTYAFTPGGTGDVADKKYVIGGASGTVVSYSDSWTQGYWYTEDGSGGKVWSNEVPTDYSDVILQVGDPALQGQTTYLYFNIPSGETLTVGGIMLGGGTLTPENQSSDGDPGSRIFTGSGSNANLHVLGDVIKTSNRSSFFYNTDVMTVDGNLSTVGGNIAMTINKLIIKGNAISSVGGRNYLTVYTPGSSFSNPSVVVKGLIDGMKVYSKASGTGSTTPNYIQVGGVSGAGALNREAPANYAQANGISYYVLVNTADASAYQSFYEKNNAIWTEQSGVMCYIMNGTANQTFTADTAFLHGGMKVLSGGMFVNFNQNAGNYTYNNSANNTVTFFTQNGGTTRAQFSHGDLEMGVAIDGLTSAGAEAVFGSASGDNTYGSFRFTNIVYASGTIKLRLNSAAQMDTLDLTSYAKFNSSDSSWEDVAGGTLKFADGVAEGTQVKFDFGDNLAWLVGDDADSVKVISWDADKKTSLTSEDFTANLFEGEDGLSYMAEFTVGDDGLYVKYVVVPEPAGVACLIGFGALALAALRRRRG